MPGAQSFWRWCRSVRSSCLTYTLRKWLENTEAAREQIVALHDERFFRMWQFYLAGGVVGFTSGTLCNYQVQYVRDRRALPITRDYMAAAEARYRALSSLSSAGAG